MTVGTPFTDMERIKNIGDVLSRVNHDLLLPMQRHPGSVETIFVVAPSHRFHILSPKEDLEQCDEPAFGF